MDHFTWQSGWIDPLQIAEQSSPDRENRGRMGAGEIPPYQASGGKRGYEFPGTA